MLLSGLAHILYGNYLDILWLLQVHFSMYKSSTKQSNHTLQIQLLLNARVYIYTHCSI